MIVLFAELFSVSPLLSHDGGKGDLGVERGSSIVYSTVFILSDWYGRKGGLESFPVFAGGYGGLSTVTRELA